MIDTAWERLLDEWKEAQSKTTRPREAAMEARTMGVQGQVLGEVLILDGNGRPVEEAATLGMARCLQVVDCCARFLRQIEGHGPTDEQVVNATVVLALNVIRAGGKGNQLTDDVRLLALELGFTLHDWSATAAKERMDS